VTAIITIDTLVLGPLETNCYVLRSDGICWVVDPGPWPVELIEFLNENKLAPRKVLLTHGHGDHIAGINDLREYVNRVLPSEPRPVGSGLKTPPSGLGGATQSGLLVACPAGDAEMLTDARANLSADFGLPITVGPADDLLRPGDVLTCGRGDWRVLDTSGHTPGGVSFYCEKSGDAIVGDALFRDSIGRCDLLGGDMARLVANIRKNLLTLPEETRVLPGHGEPTTIGREKRFNPYL
jgi:glyoxylase-like metal-dependent hydrolase (beta-lactamase superfamily II)